MKLLRLELKNFRQHLDTTIEFPLGLIGIVGPNGAGKSTIVEAISFALYGSRVLRGKVDEVRTRNQPLDAVPEVRLTLDHEGDVFRIERTLTTAKLYVGGEGQPICTGNREVVDRVGQLIGMNYEEFATTYLTEQKGLEFLSGKRGAAERERCIVRMLGYDRLEDVQARLRDERRQLRGEVSGLEVGLGSREELEARLTAEGAALAKAVAEEGAAARVLQQAEVEANSRQQSFRRLEQLRNQDQLLKASLQEQNTRFQGAEERILLIEESRKQLRAKRVDAFEVAAFLDEAVLSELLLRSERELKECTEELRQAREQVQALHVKQREEVAALEGERRALARRCAEREQERAELHRLRSEGECPTCGQPLGPAVEEGEQKLIQFLHQLKLDDEALVKRIAELCRKSAAQEQAEATLRTLSVLAEERQRGVMAAQELSRTVVAIRKFDAELLAVREQVVVLQNEMHRLRTERAALRFSEEEFIKERSIHDAAQRLLEVSRLQKTRLEGATVKHQALRDRTEEELRLFDSRKELLATKRRRLLLLEESDQLLTGFRKFLNVSIRPRLAQVAGEYLAELTDGRYTTVEMAEDFSPLVTVDGVRVHVVSGGEEDILHLCVRLALSHILADRAGHGFSLLVLDEVFGSLDEVRRRNVLELLDRLRYRFEQIIIITHLDDMKDGVQHLVALDYDEGTGIARAERATPAEFDEAVSF